MADSTPAASRGRVLLIDDDRVFGLWATKVLESRGFFIQHVLDPMSGLKHIEAEPWDLVITDVEMPRMSGLEFLERVRRMEPELPVVVVTAHPTVDRAVAAMRQPATDFIHKPVTPDDFAAKISALVAQRKPPAAAAESVLAIGAHPGDVEIGAAGALLAHQAAGIEVTVLTLSPAAPGGAGTEIRPESAEAARAIGTRLELHDLVSPDSYQADPAGAAAERAIEQIQPTVLYTHSIHDDQPDHRNAHLAAIAAARRIGRVYCFQSPSATIDFRPTRFVPIGDQIGAKLAAVGAFAAETEVRAFLEPDQVTSTALYWARYCQAQLAEAFEVVRDG
jgi:two-component system response regulator HydG